MASKNQAGRLPPQSLEAEQAVLGCMLIDPEAVPRVFHTLTEKSFFKSAHSHIYNAMAVLFEKNEAIDSISVTDQLKKSGKLEDVGGAYFITGLSTDTPTASNVEYYAKIVKEKEILRSIISSAGQMSTQAYEAQKMQPLYSTMQNKYFLIYPKMQNVGDLFPLNLFFMRFWIIGGVGKKVH